MNTGKTPAFRKRVYWGARKKSEWKIVGQNWPHVEEAKFQVWDEVLPPQMAPSDRYIIASTETLIPDDGEEYVCYGTIVYNTAYKEEKTTNWKHSVVRKGAVLETNALPGGYSSEWETKKNR
jgi:hypothetical protein